MKRVLEIAQNVYDNLESDKRFQDSVVIIHEEGTVLNYKSAFLMRYYDSEHGNWGACESPGEWLFVFTEHHGVLVYPLTDLASWEQSTPVDVAFHPDYPKDKWKCECGATFVEPSMISGEKSCPWCGMDEVVEITEE